MSQFRVSSPRFKDAICAFALIAVISILWSWVHGLRGFGDLQVPSGYGTDGLFFYALSKAYATGEIFPGLFKFVASLNAPFSAQWNDFPFGDFIYFPAGILAYVFGLSAGGWLYMLAVHVLAGLSFFVSTRVLGLDRRACMVGAVLFGLSPFLFYHSLVQATVFVCWHVPLLIVSALWCLDPSRLRLSLKQGFAFAIVSAVLAGFYNPYYWTMFLFLLAIIFAGAAYKRDWRHVLRIAVVGFMAVAGFLVFNGHALLFWYLYGRGNAFGRDLSGLVTWGLRLPDLITPVESRIGFYNSIFDNYRANYPQMLKGEAQMVYLGFVAMCGLVLLVGTSVVRVAARKFDRINDHFWIALAIFSYAVVGGINYLLGSFGFVLLRATNRHAVMLMAVGLLFVAQGISSIQNKRVLGTFAALL